MFVTDQSITPAFRVFVRAAAVSFSECSSQLVLLRMVYSDYVKQRILVYYREEELRGNRTLFGNAINNSLVE